MSTSTRQTYPRYHGLYSTLGRGRYDIPALLHRLQHSARTELIRYLYPWGWKRWETILHGMGSLPKIGLLQIRDILVNSRHNVT